MKVFGIDNPTERKSVAMGIDFLMMLWALVWIDAMSLIMNLGSSFYAVLATHFIELDSSSTISSPTCHSARRACPKLQNPLPHFVKKKLLPGDKVPARADEGWGKVLFPGPLPPPATVPPLPE